MKTIIHDLDNVKTKENSNNITILEDKLVNNCIGCFNCWTKTPMNCIHNDNLKKTSKKLLESDTLIIVSKNINGTYSSHVKKILERNIGFVYPYFVIRKNEIHHKLRKNETKNFILIIYGKTTNNEKKLLQDLALRNSYNFNLEIKNIIFCKNQNEARRKLYEHIY